MVTKMCPNFQSFDVFPLDLVDGKAEHINNDVNATKISEVDNETAIPIDVSSVTDFVGSTIEMEDTMEQLTEAQSQTAKACCINGSCDNCIKIVAKKLEQKGTNTNSIDNGSSNSMKKQ